MSFNVSKRGFEVGENLGAKPDHPRRSVGKAEGAESDYELTQMMAGVKGFHRGADRRFAVIDQQQVGVADVLQVELHDLVGGIDLAVAEIAPHRIEQDESSRQ